MQPCPEPLRVRRQSERLVRNQLRQGLYLRANILSQHQLLAAGQLLVLRHVDFAIARMAVQFLKELPYQIGLAIRPGSIDLQIVSVNDIGEALQLGLIFVGVERRVADLEAKLMDMGSPSKICQFQDQKALLAEGNPRKIEIPTAQLLPFVFGQQPGKILTDAAHLPLRRRGRKILQFLLQLHRRIITRAEILSFVPTKVQKIAYPRLAEFDQHIQ